MTNPYLRSLFSKASFPPSKISQTCSLMPCLSRIHSLVSIRAAVFSRLPDLY